ncbi:MAG: hypothetical protein QME74_05410 [Candidatus Edwardsbacteria bacterium]|nr:hypothetical protein [Candidatus Edwardsbacteria bacterium]
MKISTVIYSINVDDVQSVAKDYLGRKVTKEELKIVEDKIGDFIDWHDAIINALDTSLIK